MTPFRTDKPLDSAAYYDLVRYFATGWAMYRTPDGAGACYPGLPSWSDPRSDWLEGFSRLMPLLASWCASGRDPLLELPMQRFDPRVEFARGLQNGTDPECIGYWGNVTRKSDQRVVEAADIALSIWLTRDSVWRDLGTHVRRRIVTWLGQIAGKPGLDNNRAIVL